MKLKGKHRNLRCLCGSDRKFKHCCLYKIQGWVFDKDLSSWKRKEGSV